jgi:hypothetical protein
MKAPWQAILETVVVEGSSRQFERIMEPGSGPESQYADGAPATSTKDDIGLSSLVPQAF